MERDGPLADLPTGVLHARRLEHPVESFGYRLVEVVPRSPFRCRAIGCEGDSRSEDESTKNGG